MGLRGDDRQPTRAFWRSHFEVWELIAAALLFRWRQALGVGPLPEGATFLPIQIADDRGSATELRAASDQPTAPPIIIERAAAGIEIELIGGRRVRFDRDVDPETMKRVVSALEGAGP